MKDILTIVLTGCTRGLGRVVAAHGAPDLVINNAAVMNDPAPLREVEAIPNLESPLVLCRQLRSFP
jgi:hypothetical protein